MKVAELDRLPGLGGHTGDAFAEADDGDLFQQEIRNADLADELECLAVRHRSVEGSSLTAEFGEDRAETLGPCVVVWHADVT